MSQEIWTFDIRFMIFGRFLKLWEPGNPQGSAKGRLNQKVYPNNTDIEGPQHELRMTQESLRFTLLSLF